MAFKSLLGHSHHHHKKPGKSSDNSGKHHSGLHIIQSSADKRGCDHCPLNEVKGVKKILGKVRGRNIFVWAQSPGPQENKAEKELVDPSGEFLWEELGRVGITRDMVDIQNVVRCMPADRQNSWPPLKMRAPNKDEVRCCSIYTEKAMQRQHAKLHLIFGEIAGKAVLKKEYRKDKRIFYSETLKGWVVILYHPSYFIHMGYRAGDNRPPNDKLKRFRSDLNSARQLLERKGTDKFYFIKKQNYIGINHSKQAMKAYRYLKKKGESGTELVFDVESGYVDKHGHPKDGDPKVDKSVKAVMLACGFAAKAGTSYVFALHKMPKLHISAGTLKLNRNLVIRLLRNPKIKKSAHYGISDVDACKKLLGIRVRGYKTDTLQAEFFFDPDAKQYGLENTVARRFPDFMGYKDIRWPHAFTKKFRKMVEKRKMSLDAAGELAAQMHQMNLARLPWPEMVLYNGADCHVEYLIGKTTRKHYHPALMGIYKDASYVLFQMERDPKCQPLFDRDWSKKISKIFKYRQHKLRRKLMKFAGKYAYVPKQINRRIDWEHGQRYKVKFNPDSHSHQNWLIYDKLKMPVLRDKDGQKIRNTRKGTLNKLAIKHKKVRIVPRYNAECKVVSTYIKSYQKCAELNDGHLRTNWKLTGTGTGRLSSGATKDKKNLKVINLQNVHGDPLVKCQLISDKRWVKLYKYWLKYAKIKKKILKNKEGKEIVVYSASPVFNKHNWRRFRHYLVQLGFDFSQNELREVAEESGDVELCAMFSSKKLWKCHKSNSGCGKFHKPDPHVEVGHELTGWAREVIAHNERIRRVIKNMQFGIVFGLQGEGLYQYVIALGGKTTRKEVDKFHKRYFERFPRVRRLQEKYRAFAEKHDYVENPYGFRRNMNVKDQQQAEEVGDEREGGWWGNKAINTPIQSAAHHFLTMALAVLKRKPKKYSKLKHPQLEVHDALYFGVMLMDLFRAAKLGHKVMVDEPMRISEEEFGIKKKVKLATKPKAGFRFGVHVEGIGEEGLDTEWDFLNAWCLANYELMQSYYQQLKAIHT